MYRHSLDVLARYSLVQRVQGEWPGTAMHSLVQWRAIRRDQNQQWQWCYTIFVRPTAYVGRHTKREKKILP
jgi:hypothetical protein